MLDLLSESEDHAAALRGWSVEYVYDAARKRVDVVMLPKTFSKQFPHTEALIRAVVKDARQGDQLCMRALQLVARGPTAKTKGKKK